jgi:hypothetical protein
VEEDVELNRNVDLYLTTPEEMTSNFRQLPNEIEDRGNGTLVTVHVTDIQNDVWWSIIYCSILILWRLSRRGRESLISRFLIRKSKPVAQVLISANQVASPCQS